MQAVIDKKINDQSGHVEGDRVLTALGKILKEETRLTDITCRYGGEEFLIILPSTGIQEAGVFAERVRFRVEKSIPAGHRVTVCVGVASCSVNLKTAQSLVEKADIALYNVKNHGKNGVSVWIGKEETEQLLDNENSAIFEKLN